MFENMFTTKMSMDKKSLEKRFSKIRSKNTKASKLAATIIFVLVIAIILSFAIYVAVKKSNDNISLGTHEVKSERYNIVSKENMLSSLMSVDKSFEMKDLKDMKDVSLVAGGEIYKLLDSNSLPLVEQMLSGAKTIRGATKCSFDVTLIIYNKNLGKSKIELASDSCAIFKNQDTYYDYSDGDNSEFYSLFGIDSRKLMGMIN